MADEVKNSPPEIIYLQWFGDEETNDEDVEPSDVSWCAENIYEHDVEYIRKDKYDDLERQLAESMHDKDTIEKLEREVERIPELKRQNRELREALIEISFHYRRTPTYDGKSKAMADIADKALGKGE